MRLIVLYAFLMITLTTHAQQYKRMSSIVLPIQLTEMQSAWVDLDRDSLLDILITGIDATNNVRIVALKNQLSKFEFHDLGITGFKQGVFELADFDGDNFIDLIISGKTLINTDATFEFINQGNFQFSKQNKLTSSFGYILKIADLNQDGNKEIIQAGKKGTSHFFEIWTLKNSAFERVYDTTGLIINSIIPEDFNRDGQTDLWLSGTSTSPFCSTLSQKRNFIYEYKNVINPVAGIGQKGDFNNDGWFDVAVSGIDSNQKTKNVLYINQGGTFADSLLTQSLKANQVFAADLNSNGLTDLSFHGIDYNGKKSNIILTGIGSDNLDTLGIIHQHFGDLDRDGDLDLYQLRDSLGVKKISLFENVTLEKNRFPASPPLACAFSTYNKTYIFWETSVDDHTPYAALTYDLYLSKVNDKSTITPNFSLVDQTRMITSYGNKGTSTAAVIQNLSDDRYNYFIQAIDNSLYGGSSCKGSVIPCFDLKRTDLQACKNDTIVLTSPDYGYWFSSSKGFLGKSNSFKFVATASDTIFSFVPQVNDCAKNSAWAISVNDSIALEKETIIVCINSEIKLGIAAGWPSVQWIINNQVISTRDTIPYKITKEDTIHVVASNSGLCTYKKDFIIKISQPVLTIDNNMFKIMKGQSVTLSAAGVGQFKWSPAGSLNNSTLASPTATPITTTVYTALLTDSINCYATGQITVEVTETAFVPNLFTPNQDGKNDVLKVYGLTSSQRLRFQIFNREGSLVYEANDELMATSTGWNGTSNGVAQPPGLYYWKVEGETTRGEKILLNGKQSGSILLIR
ncbi:MAG: VCBS repeat-containing protein [Cyclobacteriaceae bacterium]|nr:VCBS repeat-containing protein [Cyclobacteriaceae bacterium]